VKQPKAMEGANQEAEAGQMPPAKSQKQQPKDAKPGAPHAGKEGRSGQAQDRDGTGGGST
jgi:hypothetical protein